MQAAMLIETLLQAVASSGNGHFNFNFIFYKRFMLVQQKGTK